MKTLPKYFAIEFKDVPLWKKYIEWINENFNEEYDYSDECWDKGEVLGVENNKGDWHTSIAYCENGTKLLTLEEWDSIVNGNPQKKKSVNLSYQTQYLRSDGILFTKDTIDGKNIEDLKQEMNNHIAEANKIRGLLKAHKNKF